MTNASNTVITTVSPQGSFLPQANRLVGDFITGSTTYVDTGCALSSVPNAAKVLYNIWASTQNSAQTTSWQLIAGSTVLATNSTTSVTPVNFKDYTATITNSSGSTNTVKIQAKTTTSGTATISGSSTNSTGILSYNGANALLITTGFLNTTNIIIGKCQITNLAFAFMCNTFAQPGLTFGIGGFGVSTTGTGAFTSVNLPNKEQFPQGLQLQLSTALSDTNIVLVIDNVMDLITIS